MLNENLDIPEIHDYTETPQQSGRNYHVKFSKFNQELKNRQQNECVNDAPSDSSIVTFT